MDHLPTDRIPVAAPVLEDAPAPAAVQPEPQTFDQHREINARRAELEDPELLRRIRSL